MLQQTDYLCGEEVPEYDTTPLAKAPPLGSRGGPEIAREPRILSEMSPATIKSTVRSILQASMRQEGRASLVPDPSSIVFGLDEALAQDERSKADDQTAAHQDAELRKTGTKRMRYDDWLESYAQELDDEKRAADARKAELAGLQADVDKSEIATKLGFGVLELDYIAPTSRDWKNLYVVASKEFRVDPAGEFEDLRTPHGAAKFWRFPAVNQVQTTLAQEKRVVSGGLPFEGPAQADIGGTGTLLSEVWSRFDEYLLAVRDYDADMRDVHEAQRRGHGPPAPRRPDPFLSTAEDFAPWMKGHTFEVFQGPGEQLFVRRVDDADADEPGDGKHDQHRLFGGDVRSPFPE